MKGLSVPDSDVTAMLGWFGGALAVVALLAALANNRANAVDGMRYDLTKEDDQKSRLRRARNTAVAVAVAQAGLWAVLLPDTIRVVRAGLEGFPRWSTPKAALLLFDGLALLALVFSVSEAARSVRAGRAWRDQGRAVRGTRP